MTNCVLMLTDVQVLPRVVQFRNDLYYSCSIKSLELRRAEATNTTVVVFFFSTVLASNPPWWQFCQMRCLSSLRPRGPPALWASGSQSCWSETGSSRRGSLKDGPTVSGWLGSLTHKVSSQPWNRYSNLTLILIQIHSHLVGATTKPANCSHDRIMWYFCPKSSYQKKSCLNSTMWQNRWFSLLNLALLTLLACSFTRGRHSLPDAM